MGPTSIRVLLIDDEPDLCEVVKEYLGRSGDFQIATANSAKEAREAMREGHFEVVVSDYQMPREDGIQLLKSLRASGNHVPFILFTGKGREEVVIEAINSGADFYLQKGGKLAPMYGELAHKIRAAARRHHAENSLRQSEIIYRSLFDRSEDLIALLDHDGTIISANAAAGRFLDRSPEELVGLNPKHMGLFTEEELDLFFAHFASSRERETTPIAFHLRLPGKEPLWVEVHLSSVDLGGSHQMIQIIVRDITSQHKALQAHEESLQAYRALAANIPGLVYRLYLRPEKKMAFFNDMALPLTGYRAEELAQGDACPLDRLIVDEDLQQVTATVKRATERGEPFQLEYSIVRKDGGLMHAFERGRPVLDKDGTPIYIDGVIFDDTRRRLTSRLELETRERFQSLFFNTMDMVAYHEMVRDAQGKAIDYRLVDFNEAFCRLTGIKAVSAKNALASQLYGGGRPPYLDEYEEVVRGGVAKRWDAHFAPTGRHLRITAVKVGENGFATITADISEDVRRERLVASARDELEAAYQQMAAVEEKLRQRLDEIQEVDDALRESEERYRMLVESSRDGVIVHRRGMVVFANQAMADILGYQHPRELVGTNSLDFLEASQRQAVAERVMRAAQTDQPAIRERLIRKDGQIVTGMVSARPLEAMGGHSAMVVIHDITEEVAVHDEVRRLNAELTLQNEINHILLLESEALLDRRLLQVALRELRSSVGFIGHVEGGPVLEIDAFSFGAGCRVPESRLCFPRSSWDTIFGRAMNEKATLRADNGIFLPQGHVPLDSVMCVPLVHGDHALGVIAVANREGGYGPEDERKLEFIAAHISPLISTRLQKRIADEERQRAEKALAEVNRKLQLLTGVTRHDIINQLTVLRGNLYLASHEKNEATAELMRAKAMTAADNIESMIRFTKEYQEMGLHAPAWQKLRPLLRKAEAGLNCKTLLLEEDLPDIEIWSDPLLLKVFANLLDNTVRHGGGATRVVIGACDKEGDLQLIYQDNGQGISLVDKGRLFERGFGKNTGYGLFFSREILEMTGIGIHEDGEPGQGARFVITVPRECWRTAR